MSNPNSANESLLYCVQETAKKFHPPVVLNELNGEWRASLMDIRSNSATQIDALKTSSAPNAREALNKVLEDVEYPVWIYSLEKTAHNRYRLVWVSRETLKPIDCDGIVQSEFSPAY